MKLCTNHTQNKSFINVRREGRMRPKSGARGLLFQENLQHNPFTLREKQHFICTENCLTFREITIAKRLQNITANCAYKQSLK